MSNSVIVFRNDLKTLSFLSLFSHFGEQEAQLAAKQPLTDDEIRQAILRWIDLTQQLEEVGHQLERIKEQYADLQYSDEIQSLAELEPIDRRKKELAVDERDLRSQSHLLGYEQAALDEQIRATLPVNVWYRVNGYRLRWVSNTAPRLVYEEVRVLEMAA